MVPEMTVGAISQRFTDCPLVFVRPTACNQEVNKDPEEDECANPTGDDPKQPVADALAIA